MSCPPTDVLLTGGIGDVIALDAHWTAEEKAAVQQLHFATRQGRHLAPLFARMPDYSGLRGFVDWWADANDWWCYLSKDHAVQWGCPIPDHVADRSIWEEFIRIRRGGLKVQQSSFLATKLAELPSGLPGRFAVIVAYTPHNGDDHQAVRNFRRQDWKDTLEWLRRRKLVGVVLNSPCSLPVPRHPRIRDFTGRTTLAEAMEIVNQAEAYCGIDSWASILSALRLPGDRLAILSRHEHLYRWLPEYYPAHQDHDFVNGWIVP